MNRPDSLDQIVDMEDKTRQEKEKRRLKSIELADFLELDIPDREKLLGEWLPTQSVCMVYAYRGVGKTHFSLNVAYAVASSTGFLNWQCESPRGVLLIDGEMPAVTLQERLATIAASKSADREKPLRILTPDLQKEAPMPDLSTPDGQFRVQEHIADDIGLIIVDNISTLTSCKENEAEAWNSVQEWALRQRAAGISVLFIHHAGKGGNQRGTSKREDILDTVIKLKHPANYEPSEGARFEVHFEKARGVVGDAVAPIEARLEINGGVQRWHCQPLADSIRDQVVELHRDKLSQKEIATELGINQSSVSRHIKKAKQDGLINE
jgi:putative DNA primase/helicase